MPRAEESQGANVRKIKPDDVRADFDALILDIEGFYDAAVRSVVTEKDQTLLAESTLLSCAVLWEGFLSDLFIAYINRDPAQFKRHLENALGVQLKENAKTMSIYEKFCKLTFPQHMTKADIQELADAQGYNVTFRNFAVIESKANQWLTARHKRQIIGLTAPQKVTVDAWIAIRNHIAHRSKSSLDRMNIVLNDGALATTGLKRGVNRVKRAGFYLKARPPPNDNSRLKIFIDNMRNIAAAI